MDYDKILVLNKGQVEEFGSPRQLLEGSGECKYTGTFKNMCLESGEYEELVTMVKKQ